MAIYKFKTGDAVPDISKLLTDTVNAVSGIGSAVKNSVSGTASAISSGLVTESNKLPVTGATKVEGTSVSSDSVPIAI